MYRYYSSTAWTSRTREEVNLLRRQQSAVVGTAVSGTTADETERLGRHVASEIHALDLAAAHSLAASDDVDALSLARTVGTRGEDEVDVLDV